VRQLVGALTLETLTQWSIDGRAIPRLAERWSWEQDGRRLRLFLRRGVTLHDGTSFSAELVATAVRNALQRPVNQALYPALSAVTDVRPDGELQLVMDLSQPSAILPEDLEFPLTVGGSNVGAGPYRVVKEDPKEVVLERFDKYYLGRPNIARIVIRPFNTMRTAWTSLLRGEVDMVTDVPPEAVEFVRNDAVQVLRFARPYQYVMAFNSSRTPFDSPAVRRALNTAVDRAAVIDNVLQGRGTPSTGPIWPRHWAYDNTVTPFGFNPELTLALLEAEGLRSKARSGGPPARFSFTCLMPANFSVLERVALEVQKQLYGVGVDMRFEVVPIESFDARVREGRFEAMLIDFISGTTLERGYQFWISARKHKGLNVFGYENPEAERIFDVLRSTTNEAAVRSATSRLQRVLLDDPPALFLAWNERARAVGTNFNVIQEEGRDPLHTLWRWTEKSDRQVQTTQ
jgi:peptide/nickel transport system substrate-binding protein